MVVFSPEMVYANPVLESARTAGEVLFVAGQASSVDGTGVDRAVAKGFKLTQGDHLVTGPQAYVYVRMADGGLLVLRPQSRLHIDRWHFDEVNPQKSEIKYTLKEGVVRYVSGKGSTAARDKFRLNTPVAAIGVRGTDFSVFTHAELTQVSVRSGGVVVSRLGNECSVDGLGPCEGDHALELFASMASSKLLQVRVGDRKPQVLEFSGSGGPDKVQPPANDEPRANNGTPPQSVLATESARADVISEIVGRPKEDLSMARWGRWGALPDGQNGATLIEQLVKNRSVMAINPYYVITNNQILPIEMPGAGVGQFRLSSHEGLVIDSQSGQVSDSTATAGSLKIDFGARRFNTELRLQADSWTSTVTSQGTVDISGKFRSDPFVSELTVDGAVGGLTASEAVYLYRQRSAQGKEAAGVASWKR